MKKGDAVLHITEYGMECPARIVVVHKNGDITIKLDDKEFVILGKIVMGKGAKFRIKKADVEKQIYGAAK